MELIVVAALFCGTALYITKLFMAQNAARHVRPTAPAAVTIPNDLLLAASKWHDAWAREQALRSIQELYETTGNWNQVRYIYSQQDGPGDS